MQLAYSLPLTPETVIFEEWCVPSSQLHAAQQELQEQGFLAIGWHIHGHVQLFATLESYVLLHITNTPPLLPAMGLLVKNLTAILPHLWAMEGIDVFDGGAVGKMALHLAAFRNHDGRLYYLVNDDRRFDFYASDFKTVILDKEQI
ncbi:MAG: hypothetical protein ACOYK8_09205 [Alphaproteobacteria bacterium]